jgi:hypothetical protein
MAENVSETPHCDTARVIFLTIGFLMGGAGAFLVILGLLLKIR